MTTKKKNQENTTDATTGQSLRGRVAMRVAELETLLAKPDLDASTRGDLEAALGQVKGLLTGDLENIPRVVAAEMSTWLEASKHLEERHRAPRHHR